MRWTHRKLCATLPDTLRLRARTYTTLAVARRTWPRAERFSENIFRWPFPCPRPSLGSVRMERSGTTSAVQRSIEIIINTFFVSANNLRFDRRRLTVMRRDVVTSIPNIIIMLYIVCFNWRPPRPHQLTYYPMRHRINRIYVSTWR